MLSFLKKHGEKPKFQDIQPTTGLTFPDFPQQRQENTNYPKPPEQKGTFLEEKQEDFPTYKPAFPAAQQPMLEPVKVDIPLEKPTIQPKEELEIPIRKPTFRSTVSPPPIEQPEQRVIHSKEDSIFVKVEKYEEAREILSEIQDKLDETQRLIEELDKAKEDEELQLRSYQESINSVKQKLIEVEKALFSE